MNWRLLGVSWRRKLERADEIRDKIDQEEPAPATQVPELTKENTEKATVFAETFLKFKPTPYQAELLDETSKRIIVIWPRQSGKSTTLAARMIWYAATHERTLSLIVAPGLRQSMILMDRIQAFLMGMAKPIRRELISKMQRTVIWFKKGSQIVALPNSPNLLRGYTAHQVLCFPGNVRVLLPDGSDIPISEVKVGAFVLSYDAAMGRAGPRRVVRIFRRKYDGDLVRIRHELGEVSCTPNHQFYAPLGKISSRHLLTGDQLILCCERFACRQTANPNAGTDPVRRLAGRLLGIETRTEKTKLIPSDAALCRPSRVLDVQVLPLSRVRENRPKDCEERWMGRSAHSLLDLCLSMLHRRSSNMLPRRQENNHARVVGEDHSPACPSDLVYGRWESGVGQRAVEVEHIRLHEGRATTPQGMARQDVEHHGELGGGHPWKGTLHRTARPRARQVPSSCETVCPLDNDVQVPDGSNSHVHLPGVLTGLHSETKCLRNSENTPVASLLLGQMPQVCTTQTKIQSTTDALQDVQPDLHAPHGKSSHMWLLLQTSVPFDEEKTVGSRIQDRQEIEVFNLEVDGNHNYFANRVLVANCDEAAFFRDDELVFFNVLFPMLQTTDGTLIASSTPWGKDSVFYRFAQNPDFKKHKINYEKVIEAGLAKREFIEEMRRELPSERFRREFEAEFVEDEMAYLSQDLITRCIDPETQLIPDATFGF